MTDAPGEYRSISDFALAPVLTAPEQLEAYWRESAIHRDSPAFAEIEQMLAGFGLDVAVWYFIPASRSFYGRGGDGPRTSPVLNIGIRYCSAYDALGIDPHSGNWNDDWLLTAGVRGALNAILVRHGHDEDFVRPDSFIFTFCWEEIAYYRICHHAKPAILEMVRNELPRTGWLRRQHPGPDELYQGRYWGTKPGIKAQYNLLFANAEDMRAAQPAVARMRQRAAAILRQRDPDGFCRDYRADIVLWHRDMKDVPPLYRED